MAALNLTETQRTRALFGLLVAALILIAISTFSFFTADTTSKQQTLWGEQIRGLGEDALTLATQAENISRGVNPVFFELLLGSDNLNLALDDLDSGAPRIDMRPLPSSLRTELAATRASVAALTQTIGLILGAEQSYSTLVQERAVVLAALELTATQAADVIDNARNRRPDLVAAAGTQWALIERIRAHLGSVILTGAGADQIGTTIATDWAALKALQATLRGTVPAPQDEISASLDRLIPSIENIISSTEAVGSLQVRAASARGQARDVLANARALEQALADQTVSLDWVPTAAFIGLIIATAAIALFLILFFRGFRQRADRAAEREAKQQQAILGLLDEITNLADGDLTVDVTVTEDFTGAIADSLNYTVQNMRELVGTINQTSARVAGGADATQQLAQRMSAGSERQASDIAALTQQMAATATTLTAVAERAESVAEQAEESVDVARGGAETARGTINVMTALREQIQDTSKRIKRLGESSQEIGNIIELINDIAEQTGTLALNAAIQAAMAGEQGRGFAVVAGEVRNLAGNSADAARQIKQLIETSAVEVQEGSTLVEQASETVKEVVAAVKRVTDIMDEISAASQEQSGGIEQVSQAVSQMDEVTQQNASLVEEASSAAASLEEQARRLEEAVSIFRLDSEAGEPTMDAAVVPMITHEHDEAEEHDDGPSEPKPHAVQETPRQRSEQAPRESRPAPRREPVTTEDDWEEF